MDSNPNPSGKATETSTPNSAPAIKVSAVQLYRAYQRNEVSADSTYKDRLLEVNGTVESIDKNVMDDVVLRLATGDMISNVDATLKSSEESTAGQLEKRQQVTLLCKGAGMVIGSPQLNECTFSSK